MKARTLIVIVAVSIMVLFSADLIAFAADVFDDQTPLDVLNQAAANGNPNAQFVLAERIINGQAVSQPEQRALDESQQELAAALSKLESYASSRSPWEDFPADVPLSTMLYSNMWTYTGLPTDESTDASALTCMANFLQQRTNYLELSTLIEKKELQEATNLLEASIAKGNTDAMVSLGFLYLHGKNVPYDSKRAFQFYFKAADLGSSRAMLNIGEEYAAGQNEPTNLDEAMKWFERASKRGGDFAFDADLRIATILQYGGWGKNDGYPKNPERAYALGRGVQLASRDGSRARQWGTEIVGAVGQYLSPEQLMAAEREAETVSNQLSVGASPTFSPPSADLKNHAAMTKEEWKARFAEACPSFEKIGFVNMNKQAFLNICGDPDKTQTVEDKIYWYYTCKDGDIQFELDSGPLMVGTVAGHLNDY